MILNVPNSLTLLRIIAIPLVIIIYYSNIQSAGEIAAIIFAIAGITDWFDGYFARKLNQTSPFGAFLDPVADKLMVAAVLIIVVESFGGIWLALAAVVIIGREITISALREWMAELGKRSKVKVSYLGKVKTTVQMFALFFLLYEHPLLGLPTFTIGFALIMIATALTLWSMIVYVRAAMK